MYKKLSIFLSVLILGCSDQSPHPLNQSSDKIKIANYNSFEEYLAKTQQLIKENRYFITEDENTELVANMPFELRPQNEQRPTKAVLLIHGLGDSPYSYIDIAKSLVAQNYLVRTLLLPGHGTKPGDMLNLDYQDWNEIVRKQVELLKKEVDNVYLGGYSTGGNLAYSYAMEDESIKGLMLFAPAFVAADPLAFLTPYISKIIPWVGSSEPKNITNYTRYYATPTNGYAQYYKTSQEVQKKLKDAVFTRPVFMVLSEHDSVIDSKAISESFYTRFNNENNKLVWYGETAPSNQQNTIFINSYSEEFRVSTMSHLGMMFKANNPYYGIDGTERICSDDGNDTYYQRCKTDAEIWYGAWGGAKNDNIHARLTFNPWFTQMMDSLESVF